MQRAQQAALRDVNVATLTPSYTRFWRFSETGAIARYRDLCATLNDETGELELACHGRRGSLENAGRAKRC
jgi:hypothetical protein